MVVFCEEVGSTVTICSVKAPWRGLVHGHTADRQLGVQKTSPWNSRVGGKNKFCMGESVQCWQQLQNKTHSFSPFSVYSEYSKEASPLHNGTPIPTQTWPLPWVSNGNMSAPQSCHLGCSQKTCIHAEGWKRAVSCWLVLEEMGEYLSLLQEPQKCTRIRQDLATADIVIMDESVLVECQEESTRYLMQREESHMITDERGLSDVCRTRQTDTLERSVDKPCLICETDTYTDTYLLDAKHSSSPHTCHHKPMPLHTTQHSHRYGRPTVSRYEQSHSPKWHHIHTYSNACYTRGNSFIIKWYNNVKIIYSVVGVLYSSSL